MSDNRNPIRAQWPSGIALQDWAAASRAQASTAARGESEASKVDGKPPVSADTAAGAKIDHISSVD